MIPNNKRLDLRKAILSDEMNQGGLQRIRQRICIGGKERYAGLIELVARVRYGLDISLLKTELVPCLFDKELGTYQRAYQLFGIFVNDGVDLEDELPKLLERAGDYYHSGQQLQRILCRYAEQSSKNASLILKLFPKEKPIPEWINQIEYIAKIPIQIKTLHWGNYGVAIGEGKLSWFQTGSVQYSQSYTEFLRDGLKFLWIDRVMPEDIRQQLYTALGSSAPYEPSLKDRENEFLNFLRNWETREFKQKESCNICSKLPDHSSKGENNSTGAWDDLPPERYRLVALASDLHRHEILGCEECGQLYDYWTEHDNILGQQEDAEYVEKISPDSVRKIWQDNIKNGERIKYLF